MAAIVTGGGTGIGAAIARRLTADGHAVAVMGRRPEPLADVAGGLHDGIAVVGDVGRPEDCARAVAEAVAGFGPARRAREQRGHRQPGAGEEMLTIDRRPRTTSGFLAGPGWTSYCTSKAGLIMLTRCLANDYGPRGVRANCVCPGWVRTPMGDEDMDVLGKTRGVDRDGAYALLHEDVPLRRPGEADEIASVVSFLAGPDAAYVNGVALPVDGGDDLRPHRLRSRSPRESPGLPHPWRLDGARARALQG